MAQVRLQGASSAMQRGRAELSAALDAYDTEPLKAAEHFSEAVKCFNMVRVPNEIGRDVA